MYIYAYIICIYIHSAIFYHWGLFESEQELIAKTREVGRGGPIKCALVAHSWPGRSEA